MSLESITFDFDGTKVELKVEMRIEKNSSSRLCLVEKIVTRSGLAPERAFMRYDIDKCVFIDPITTYDEKGNLQRLEASKVFTKVADAGLVPKKYI